MEAVKVLEDILAKKDKGDSNISRESAAEALKTLFLENNDPKKVVEYLMRLHYSISQAFLEEFCESATDEQITELAEALLNDEQFKNGSKSNNIMYPKGLSAVLALASKEKYQSAFLILLKILSTSEKSDGFSDGCVNNFKKLIVEKNGLPFILNLFEQMTNNAIACKEFEQQRLTRFLKTIENMAVTTTKEDVSVVAQNSESIKISATETGKFIDVSFPLESNPAAKPDSLDMVYKIEKTQQYILNYVRGLVEDRKSINALTVILAQRDEELKLLRDVVSEKERRIVSLASEVAAKDSQLSEAKRQVDDLTERLRTSFQMDEISRSQELITLKNDISEALRLDYADFVKSKDSSYNEDLFEAYRSTLTRIFKLLRRFGITCQ